MVMRYYAASPSTRSVTTSRQRAVNWGWVCALGPFLVGLLLLARRQPLSRTGHMLLQCAIVLLVYGLLALWLQTNRAALGAPKLAAKPKFVYVAYPPVVAQIAYKPASALPDVMSQRLPQGISLAALPLCDNISLQDRRN